MRQQRYLGTVLLLVGIFLSPHGVWSAMATLSLQYLAQQADTIVIGTVTQKKSSWNEHYTAIYTDVRLTVEAVITGTPVHEVTVRVDGGIVDGIGMETSVDPKFQDGEQVLVFLDTSQRPYQIVGLQQGKCVIKAGQVMWRGHPMSTEVLVQAIRAARR